MKTKIASVTTLLMAITFASTANAISVNSVTCANPALFVNLSASTWDKITHQDLYVRGTNSSGYSWTLSESIDVGTGVHYYFNFGDTPIGDFVNYTIFTPQTNLGSGSCN